MIEVKIIEHNSADYHKMVQLRTEILRKPLGLTYAKEQLEAENADILIAAFNLEKLIGCCILSKFDESTLQLRQMAVANEYQSLGIGSQIIHFAENFCLQNQIKTIILHARATAVEFYQKLEYEIVGEEYLEVGIPHFNMEKKVSNSINL